MLRTYIFSETKSHWIEEENRLLMHDICAILDEESKTIYIWNGPKSTKERFKKGYNLVNELISSFPDSIFQLIVLKKGVPINIQEKLDSMLKDAKKEKDESLKFSRFTTIRFYFALLLSAVILPLISIINLSSSLFWSGTNGNYEVDSSTFENWIKISKILIIITLILLIINVGIGIIELENQTIIFSINGVIICIGLVLYLNYGIHLFLFQEGSTLYNYFISKRDIVFFLIVSLVAISFFEIPNIYKLISFFKTYRKFIF